MTTDKTSFAQSLLQVESTNPELRRQYEARKLELTERRLTAWQRWSGWLALPVYALLIATAGYRLLTKDLGLPGNFLPLFAVGVLALAGAGVWLLRVLMDGRITGFDRRTVEWISLIGVGALSLALFEIAQSVEDVRVALRLHAATTMLLVASGFSLLFERIRRSRLESRVELLELELRVAELSQPVGR